MKTTCNHEDHEEARSCNHEGHEVATTKDTKDHEENELNWDADYTECTELLLLICNKHPELNE